MKSVFRLSAVMLASTLVLAACAPLKTINALTPGGSYRLQADVAYGSHPRQRLDIYEPVSVAAPAGHPMVVFFYGGSWNTGSRSDYKFLGEALASRGVMTLIADYRLYPEVRYPDFLTDSAAAVAHALRQAAALGGDPARVFVMGHSAGGYNAAMLALDERWLKEQGRRPGELAGWIGLAGPYEFLPIVNPDVKPVFFHPNYPEGTQPISHVSAKAPRSFIGAAKSDSLVDPLRNSQQLADRLRSAGVPVAFRLYDRASHVTLAGAFARPLRWIAPVLDDVADFIAQAPADADQRRVNGAR